MKGAAAVSLGLLALLAIVGKIEIDPLGCAYSVAVL